MCACMGRMARGKGRETEFQADSLLSMESDSEDPEMMM